MAETKVVAARSIRGGFDRCGDDVRVESSRRVVGYARDFASSFLVTSLEAASSWAP